MLYIIINDFNINFRFYFPILREVKNLLIRFFFNLFFYKFIIKITLRYDNGYFRCWPLLPLFCLCSESVFLFNPINPNRF
jgi:hypothetical protein